jgi:hypothetical protein
MGRGGESERTNLDEVILEVVDSMQPISSRDIQLEIEENLDAELSHADMEKRLKQLELNKAIASAHHDDGKKYLKAGGQGKKKLRQ